MFNEYKLSVFQDKKKKFYRLTAGNGCTNNKTNKWK